MAWAPLNSAIPTAWVAAQQARRGISPMAPAAAARPILLPPAGQGCSTASQRIDQRKRHERYRGSVGGCDPGGTRSRLCPSFFCRSLL